MIKLQDKTSNEQESSELGPVVQAFFKTVISISCFIAPPMLLYAVYVILSLLLHRHYWGE